MHHGYREKRGGRLGQRERNKDVIKVKGDENHQSLMLSSFPGQKSNTKAIIMGGDISSGPKSLSRS